MLSQNPEIFSGNNILMQGVIRPETNKAMVKVRHGSLEWQAYLQLGYTHLSTEGDHVWLVWPK